MMPMAMGPAPRTASMSATLPPVILMSHIAGVSSERRKSGSSLHVAVSSSSGPALTYLGSL